MNTKRLAIYLIVALVGIFAVLPAMAGDSYVTDYGNEWGALISRETYGLPEPGGSGPSYDLWCFKERLERSHDIILGNINRQIDTARRDYERYFNLTTLIPDDEVYFHDIPVMYDADNFMFFPTLNFYPFKGQYTYKYALEELDGATGSINNIFLSCITSPVQALLTGYFWGNIDTFWKNGWEAKAKAEAGLESMIEDSYQVTAMYYSEVRDIQRYIIDRAIEKMDEHRMYIEDIRWRGYVMDAKNIETAGILPNRHPLVEDRKEMYSESLALALRADEKVEQLEDEVLNLVDDYTTVTDLTKYREIEDFKKMAGDIQYDQKETKEIINDLDVMIEKFDKKLNTIYAATNEVVRYEKILQMVKDYLYKGEFGFAWLGETPHLNYELVEATIIGGKTVEFEDGEIVEYIDSTVEYTMSAVSGNTLHTAVVYVVVEDGIVSADPNDCDPDAHVTEKIFYTEEPISSLPKVTPPYEQQEAEQTTVTGDPEVLARAGVEEGTAAKGGSHQGYDIVGAMSRAGTPLGYDDLEKLLYQ